MAMRSTLSVKFVITAIFSVLILAVFLWLGFWQLDRLAWKHDVLAKIDHKISGIAVPLPNKIDRTRDRYLPVEIEGEILATELHVLVSTKNMGAGFRVIQPMKLRSGQHILLDRGFIAVNKKNEQRQIGAQKIIGNLHWPDERDGFTPADDPDNNYWYARDVDQMAGVLKTAPVMVIARTKTDPLITPLPVTTLGIANNHFQYAMTWFLMAMTWTVMTGYALWRMKVKQREIILKEH